MKDNIKKTKEYFDKNYEKLRFIKNTKQAELINSAALMLNKKLEGKILDIGSGGESIYASKSITKIVSLDISSQSLKAHKNDSKTEFILGDARRLDLADNIFDCAVTLFVLHHIAGNNLSETSNNAKSCFEESHRVLKPGGKILIVEPVLNKAMWNMENILFNSLFLCLRLFNKPMIYYFSLNILLDLLHEAGFRNITFSYLDTKNAKLCPCTCSIGIPFKYTPVSHVIIEGVK